MSWYEGIEEIDYKEFLKDKIKIANNLYFDKKNNSLSFINDLKIDSPLYSFSDPKMDILDSNQIFYNFIFDNDLKNIKDFIFDFDKLINNDEQVKISLYRKEDDKFYWYSYGRIVSHLLNDQENLIDKLPNSINKDNLYIVPLNKYYFECPICFNRTLQKRYEWEICPECGWEDEGIPFGANGCIKPTKELLEKYPALYEEYLDFYKHQNKIPDEEKVMIDLNNLDESILLTMIPEVYRENYLKEKEKNPNYHFHKDSK